MRTRHLRNQLRTLIRSTAWICLLATIAVAGMAVPAGAQQLINGSEQGGWAFVALAVMCFVFVAIMFWIDKARSGGDKN